MYTLGILMGVLLLAAKMGSLYLLTGGDKQWSLPFTKGEGVRDWIYRSNVRKGILDIAGGYVGAHVLVAFGGSIIALIAMTTYIITCMGVIFSSILAKKVVKALTFTPSKRRRSLCY